jgi:hypothetical protein
VLVACDVFLEVGLVVVFVLREPWGGIGFELEDGFGVCEGAVGYLVPGFMMAVLVGGFGYETWTCGSHYFECD